MRTGAGSSGKDSIQNNVMWLRKIKLTTDIQNAINQRFNSETVSYPPRRVEVKTFTVAMGSQSKFSKMPKRVLISFVESAKRRCFYM